MLIGLVRDSVLQCFCHSCKAPLGIVVCVLSLRRTRREGVNITANDSYDRVGVFLPQSMVVDIMLVSYYPRYLQFDQFLYPLIGIHSVSPTLSTLARTLT
ncbi:hypothetical protein E2986_06464 [Frieseomelitta varia]|uniref:Uncharacterized protein n=1 Tax=Frieseomelitta varia TaxID=561572 RepID=A0A833RE79_9HYME|nr:hypothetical protein E2986_06464 [Frieseomelitta varia]